jgi:hypothetical protein
MEPGAASLVAQVGLRAMDQPPGNREAYVRNETLRLTGQALDHDEVRRVLREGVRELSRRCEKRPKRQD